MTSPLLGEFLGTMILIVLGDGAVAAVLLEALQSRRQWMDRDHCRLAFAVMAGVFTAIASEAAMHISIRRDDRFCNARF